MKTRKTVSLLLAISLVFTLMFIPSASADSPSPYNLPISSNFETGTDDWVGLPGMGSPIITQETTDTFGGSEGSLRVDMNSDWGSAAYYTRLKPNVAYKFSYWIKIDGASTNLSASRLRMLYYYKGDENTALSNPDSSYVVYDIADTTPTIPSYTGGFTLSQQWKKIEGSFIYTGKNSSNANMNTDANGYVPGYMTFRLGVDGTRYKYWIDDFKLEELRSNENMIVNGDFNPFANPSYSNLSSSPGSKLYGFRGYGDCGTEIVAPGRDGTGYCVKVNENAYAPLGVDSMLNTITFKQGVNYELSVWVKMIGADNYACFIIPSPSGFKYIGTTNNGTASAGIPVKNGVWKQIKCTYIPDTTYAVNTVGTGQDSIALRIDVYGHGAISYYLDDFVIREAVDNLVVHPAPFYADSFNTGSSPAEGWYKYSSSNVSFENLDGINAAKVAIVASWGTIFKNGTKVIPGNKYRVSADVKLVSATGDNVAQIMLKETIGGSGVTRYFAQNTPVFADRWTTLSGIYTANASSTGIVDEFQVRINSGQLGSAVDYYTTNYVIEPLNDYPNIASMSVENGQSTLKAKYAYNADYNVNEGSSYYEFRKVDAGIKTVLYSGYGIPTFEYPLKEADKTAYFEFEVTPIDTNGKVGVSKTVRNSNSIFAAFDGAISTDVGATVVFRNNSSESKHISVIIALYNGDNKFLSMDYVNDEIAAGAYQTYTPNIDITGNEQNLKAKVFVWDKLSNGTLVPYFDGIVTN